MKKLSKHLAFFLILPLCIACSSRVQNPRFVINEVLVINEQNYVDDYGQRSGWIEIFNNTAKTQDLGGLFLTNDRSNPRKYPIPKGDVLTKLAPHQHVLFWANNKPYQGTFYISFELNPDAENYIALYDESGTKLIDEVTIPKGQLPDVSWGYKTDGVKFNREGANMLAVLEKVTPSTNNYTLDKNEKVERFKHQDKFGASMTITSMLVVFLALVLLYIVFKLVGKGSVGLNKRKKEKDTTVTEGVKPETNEIPGEVLSAIFMALHEEQSDVHDFEHTILTFNKINRNYSPWSSKIYGLRQTPRK
ncbi:MAG: lamin tail domain-containing protein [Porphyromonadaceae bacterium]|nr:lamin tail domain-containing protein [Porphyromonadaceae bacterium]